MHRHDHDILKPGCPRGLTYTTITLYMAVIVEDIWMGITGDGPMGYALESSHAPSSCCCILVAQLASFILYSSHLPFL